LSPCDLDLILKDVSLKKDENLLRGIEGSEDAAVYRLTDELAIVQTVDFFTPIVNDSYLFGQIAAANSLSDIYAMGADPLTAMNLVMFNPEIGLDVLQEIIRGGRDKVEEAGAVIVGGHTVEDKEPKFGLSVTGTVHPDRFISNSNAKVGDKLVLTKPIGMGILATALKGELVEEEDIMEAINSIRTLNRDASLAMREVGVNSCTDVTGFGLLGHLMEMLLGSGVSAVVWADAVPKFERAFEFAEMGLVPAGACSNRKYVGDRVQFSSKVNEIVQDILFDPQTSGGLLISVSAECCDDLIKELEKRDVPTRAVIGEIVEKELGKIEVI